MFTTTDRRRFAAILTCLLLLCVDMLQAAVVQWRRDFSGHFPEQHPPLQWSDGSQVTAPAHNERHGRYTYTNNGRTVNIAWSSPLPNWSNSSIIVVDNRVLLTCEPTGFAPWLLCFDATNGKELWRREVASIYQRNAELAAAWGRLWEEERQANVLAIRYQQAHEQQDDTGSITADIQKLGRVITFDKRRQVHVLERQRQAKNKDRQFKAHGLHFCTWGLGSRDPAKTWVGHGYPCPISDGSRIWMFTGYDDLACFNMDGTLLWIRHYSDRDNPKARGPGCTYTAHPLWIDNTIILTDGNGSFIRAVEPQDGSIRWQLSPGRYSQHSNHSPAPLDLNGTAAFFHASGSIYRVSDGQVLATGLGGMGKGTGVPLSDGKRVYFTSNASKAIDIEFQGGAASVKTAWTISGKANVGGRTAGLVHDGKIFTGTHIYKTSDGSLFRKHAIKRPRGCFGIDFIRAGNVIICGGAGGHYMNSEGAFYVLDARTGKHLATNWLAKDEVNEAKLQQIQRETGRNSWYSFWNGSAFAAHDRLYLRSNDRLYCIGQTQGQ